MAYILLSIAYKRSDNIEEATRVLSSCIRNHSDYPDAFIARGQALLAQGKFQEAQGDFKSYSTLLPMQSIGYIGIGDSQKALGLQQEALGSYSRALKLIQPN